MQSLIRFNNKSCLTKDIALNFFLTTLKKNFFLIEDFFFNFNFSLNNSFVFISSEGWTTSKNDKLRITYFHFEVDSFILSFAIGRSFQYHIQSFFYYYFIRSFPFEVRKNILFEVFTLKGCLNISFEVFQSKFDQYFIRSFSIRSSFKHLIRSDSNFHFHYLAGRE